METKMDKIKFLVINGRAILEDDAVNYKPYEMPNLNTSWSDDNQGIMKNYAFCTVRSNIKMQDGELSFNYKINDITSHFEVIFWMENGNLSLSFNEGNFLFSLKTLSGTQTTTILNTGDKISFDPNVYNTAKLIIKGGILRLFVNDILILTNTSNIQGAIVDFIFHGPGEINISDVLFDGFRQTCFVVMQFSKEFNELYETIIKPLCLSNGYKPVRADESYDNNFIIHEILTEIKEASVIIADITPDNPNVYYEVGYAHALGKKVILLCNDERTKLPFDLSGFRTVFYSNTIAGHTQVKEKLNNHFNNVLNRSE